MYLCIPAGSLISHTVDCKQAINELCIRTSLDDYNVQKQGMCSVNFPVPSAQISGLCTLHVKQGVLAEGQHHLQLHAC